jgi:hypothetical protein
MLNLPLRPDRQPLSLSLSLSFCDLDSLSLPWHQLGHSPLRGLRILKLKYINLLCYYYYAVPIMGGSSGDIFFGSVDLLSPPIFIKCHTSPNCVTTNHHTLVSKRPYIYLYIDACILCSSKKKCFKKQASASDADLPQNLPCTTNACMGLASPNKIDIVVLQQC